MSNIKSDIRDLLLAISMNSKIKIQVVTTVSYSSQRKQLATKFGIEYLKRCKYFDEEYQKNKYRLMTYKTEVFTNMTNLYKRLGEIYYQEIGRKLIGGDDG